MDWNPVIAIVGSLTVLGLTGLVHLSRGIARLEAEGIDLEKRTVAMREILDRHLREPQHGSVPYVTEPLCKALHNTHTDRFTRIEDRLDRIEGKLDSLIERGGTR